MSKPSKPDWEAFILANADYDVTRYQAVAKTPMHILLKRIHLLKKSRDK